MSLVSNINVKVKGSTSNATDFKPATLWINLGFPHPELKDKNGNPMIITLPLGIPLDNDKVSTCSSNAPENIKLATECSNELKQQLVDYIKSNLEPGERKELTDSGLHIYLQRANEKDTTDEENLVKTAKQTVSSVLKFM